MSCHPSNLSFYGLAFKKIFRPTWASNWLGMNLLKGVWKELVTDTD